MMHNPLSPEDVYRIDRLFGLVIDNPDCFGEFLVDFVDSNVARLARYQQTTRFSEKQMQVIKDIAEAAAKEGLL